MHRTTTARGCLCGHSGDAHEHYHRGRTCALCGGCREYRSAGPVTARVEALRRMITALRPVSVTAGPLTAGPEPDGRPRLYLVR